jgi:hypothetical protein
VYVAQSGLIGNGLPTHKSLFTAPSRAYVMQQGQDKLEVRLSWSDGNGVQVDKIYTFQRGSYVTELTHEIHNSGAAELVPSVYYQIVHDSQSDQGSMMMPTFTGAAYYTDADKYKKISFDDMKKSNLSKNANDGWIALVQHYFVGAWIPAAGTPREYYSKQLAENIYSMGSVRGTGQDDLPVVCRSPGTDAPECRRARTGVRGGLRLADGDCLAAVLGAVDDPEAGAELGGCHHPADRTDQAGVLSTVGQELQVHGADARAGTQVAAPQGTVR